VLQLLGEAPRHVRGGFPFLSCRPFALTTMRALNAQKKKRRD